MRRYETIFIVKPDIGEDDTAGIVEKVTSIIKNDGGAIIKIDEWGLKKLAYLIKKERQGYYIYIDYAGTPASVTEIERVFKIDDRLLKYMTVKLADSFDPEAIIEEMSKKLPQKTDEETTSAADQKTKADSEKGDDGVTQSAAEPETEVDSEKEADRVTQTEVDSEKGDDGVTQSAAGPETEVDSEKEVNGEDSGDSKEVNGENPGDSDENSDKDEI